MQSWSEYFELSKNNAPSSLLETAIPLAPDREQALDLGAGSLKDSKFLLSMGFRHVTAIDGDPAIKKYADKIPATILKIQIKKLENLQLPNNRYDLINASYSLPFTKPPHLPALVEQIISALKPGGIFCGQFFGPQDSWNTPENQLSFTDSKTVKKLLSPLKIIHFQEEQLDANTIDGEAKHWHLFHIIAGKT
jgi:SAM-dependent methyltransferase